MCRAHTYADYVLNLIDKPQVRIEAQRTGAELSDYHYCSTYTSSLSLGIAFPPRSPVPGPPPPRIKVQPQARLWFQPQSPVAALATQSPLRDQSPDVHVLHSDVVVQSCIQLCAKSTVTNITLFLSPVLTLKLHLSPPWRFEWRAEKCRVWRRSY